MHIESAWLYSGGTLCSLNLQQPLPPIGLAAVEKAYITFHCLFPQFLLFLPIHLSSVLSPSRQASKITHRTSSATSLRPSQIAPLLHSRVSMFVVEFVLRRSVCRGCVEGGGSCQGRRWGMHTFGYNYYHELRILKG